MIMFVMYVSISHDLNREQREERNKLVESAKNYNLKIRGNIYIG